MKQSSWFLLTFLLAFPSMAQTSDFGPSQAKSPNEMNAILAESFARNTFAYLPGPYHFLATFQTFNQDGEPDGEGSIEKFFASPGHLKVIRRFRDHTSTEYFNGGPPSYTDDGSEGSIMSYFVNNFLLFPLPPPPMGPIRKDLEANTMQFEDVVLDCARYQFYVSPAIYPAAPQEALCVTRPTQDLFLTQTLVFSVRYQNLSSFLGRSIPRDIVAYEGPLLRCRIHMQQVDEMTLDERLLTPPANATPAKPGVEWRATSNAEDTPKRHPLPPGITLPHKNPAAAYGEFLVLRSRTGTVIDVQPIYAPKPELAKIAADALKQWVFPPLVRQGEAVETISTVHLAFAAP